MSELTVGREMDAAVAKALGWHTKASTWGDTAHDLLVDSNGLTLYLVAEWQPSTSDSKAFAALDAVMALPRWRQVCVEIVNLVNAHGTNGWCVRLYYSPEEQRGYIERLGATRAEAICRAILALAEATT